jgi:hypothetical protein
MSSLEPVWFICNSSKMFQSGPMDLAQVKKACADIPLSEAANWYIWRDGFESWKPVFEVKEIFAQKEDSVLPPPIPQKPVVNLDPNAYKTDPNKVRKHERHPIRLRIIIRNEERVFSTTTKDISLGGIALETPLPLELFTQECEAFIAGPDQNEKIRFTLEKTSRNDLRYFVLKPKDQAQLEKLKAWLAGKSETEPSHRSKLDAWAKKEWANIPGLTPEEQALFAEGSKEDN